MAKVKHEYFPTRAGFDTARDNTTAYNNSVCYIEDSMEIFTHGHFWGIGNLSQYYDSTTQKLQLKNGSTVISELDATPFIKDAMLDSVELITTQEQGVSTQVPYLKFTFNTVKETASGTPAQSHTVIRVSMSDFINSYDGSNLYLSSNYAMAQAYATPIAGESFDTVTGKFAKAIHDIDTSLEWVEHTSN